MQPGRVRREELLRWGLPLASGVLLAVSTPGGPAPLLALVALAPWAISLSRSARVSGGDRWKAPVYLAGLLHFAVFSRSFGSIHWSAWAITAVVGALYPVLAGALFRGLSARVPAAVGLPLAWAAVEWLRATMPGILYPHAQLGHALYGTPWLVAGAAWWSEAGVNCAVAAVSGVCADAWTSWRVRSPEPRVFRAVAALVVLLFALPAAARLSRGPTAPDDEPVRFLCVQPGMTPQQLATEKGQRELANTLLRLTHEELSGAGPAPHLVVWPESSIPAIPTDPNDQRLLDPNDPVLRDVSQAARSLLRGRSFLLAGSGILGPGKTQQRVAALLLGKDGKVRGVTEKEILVPGGESFPLFDWFPESLQVTVIGWIRSLSGGLAPTISPGQHRELLRLQPDVPFAGLVCFENAFPDFMAARAREGARFFVVLSNESWYRGGLELDQMVAMTVFRALETGKPVLRCTNDGITCLVGGDGRVLARLVAGGADRCVPGTLRGELRPSRALPPAVHLGAWVGPLLWVGCVLVLWLGWRVPRTWDRLFRSPRHPVSPKGTGRPGRT